MKRILIVSLLSIGLVAVVEAAKLKIRAEPDPTFDFAIVHTFAFDPDAGDVMMARTQKDDPAPLKAFLDPRIRKYVGEELAKKNIRPVSTGAPDVFFRYYVLVSSSANGQSMGQFLPSVPYWGLPPFGAGTTSLEVVTKGSLVLDALLPGATGERKVIWRGIAQSTVEDIDADAVRDARLRDAAAGLIKRFPLKKAK